MHINVFVSAHIVAHCLGWSTFLYPLARLSVLSMLRFNISKYISVCPQGGDEAEKEAASSASSSQGRLAEVIDTELMVGFVRALFL
jgi:hypothetical protein